MGRLSKHIYVALALLAFGLFFQSCNEQGIQLDKQKVQFSLSPASAYSPAVNEIDLPENARAWISVSSSNGASILSDHEIAVFKSGDIYVTDPIELTPGSYMVTDFMIVKDSVDLYVAPKKGAEFATSEADALPYRFSIPENDATTVSMQVMNVRNQDLQKFGYASSRAKAKANSISIAAYEDIQGNLTLTSATAELRQNKTLLKVFSLAAAANTITLGGNPNLPYTLTVYTATSAKTQTFNIKQLKKDLGKNPLEIVLEPALVLAIEAYDDEGDYPFEFVMGGSGAVNINWGDGEQSATTLPLQIAHEYLTGSFTAIVTGDIDQVTDFYGFSYSTIMLGITGLTNLTSLKVYNPSWGAVPIKVDLSNCKQLETIYIAKYGAPYEPCDLRTDFKLPPEHNINSFILDIPSFDSNREFVSAEELEVMVNNIYNNVLNRQISNGQFFVYPVVAPAPETQLKIDVLTNEYNWQVGFNNEIYGAFSSEAASSRIASDLNANASREQWLRGRFSNGQQIIERAPVTDLVN
jgi:hypothetical protein